MLHSFPTRRSSDLAGLAVLLQLDPGGTGTAVEGLQGGEKTQVGTASILLIAGGLDWGAEDEGERGGGRKRKRDKERKDRHHIRMYSSSSTGF